MKQKIYLLFIIISAFFIILNNISLYSTKPIHSAIDILLVIILFLFSVLYGRNSEKYEYKTPNIYIGGKNIAGTVYVEDPDNVPGLGWIN